MDAYDFDGASDWEEVDAADDDWEVLCTDQDLQGASSAPAHDGAIEFTLDIPGEGICDLTRTEIVSVCLQDVPRACTIHACCRFK